MQRNTGIQIFIYFIAILFGIAVVFWPESEEDKEKSKDDEFIEITAEGIKGTAKGIIYSPITIFNNARASNNKKIYTLLTFTLLLLLFIPTVVPSFVNTANTPDGIGILGIEDETATLYTDSLNGYEQCKVEKRI